MNLLLYLQPINDPLSEENIAEQVSIINSDEYFLQMAEGKRKMSSEYLIKETEEYLQLGAKFIYIQLNNDRIGLVHFIPCNPYDHHCWLSLFIIEKNYQRKQLGVKSYHLVETKIKEELKVNKVRLCVQVFNERGAEFWKRNGYVKIGTTRDKNKFPVHIYEKTL